MSLPFRLHLPAALPGLALFALVACAPATPTLNPELPYPPARPAQLGDYLHLPTGHYVSEAEMLAALTDARIVYCGETHDNPASHRLQERVLRALHARYPGQVALGMEMFNPEQQPVLDRWSAGELDEKTFLKEAGWYEVWRQDFAYYRDLLQLARELRIPVIGLNAPKDLVRTVGRTPLEELDAETRARLPELDFDDPYQRALVKAIYGGHEEGSAMFDGFLRVQTLWDETMAHNIALYLGSPQGEGQRMLVVAGGNHVRYDFGIPRRVFRRLPLSYAKLGGSEIIDPEVKAAKPERYLDVTLPTFATVAYDYLAFIPYEELELERPKMGVALAKEESGVVVMMVLENSGAAEAGMLAGDRLISVGESTIETVLDLKYELEGYRSGDQVPVTIERGDERLKFPVTLQ